MPDFASFVMANLLRRRSRTLLTAVGIGIGIATVVTLGVLAASTRAASESFFRVADSDALVAQAGAADLSFSTLGEDDLDAIAQTEGVERAMGVLMHVERTDELPYFVLFGADPEALAESPPELIDGKLLEEGEDDQVMLGERAADELQADVGNTVEIGRSEFEVVGIHTDDSPFLTGGAWAPLETTRRLAGRRDAYTLVLVQLGDGASIDEVRESIEDEYANLAVVASLDDFGEVDQGIQIIDAVNFALSLLAVVIGAIGVMNTMIMSVFERTREIGVLRALGWKRGRVLRMVLGEALALCLLGAVAGSALGVAASQAFLLNATFRALLELQYPPEVFVRGFAVAIVVAVAGAAYPAWRATQLTPMEALRHE